MLKYPVAESIATPVNAQNGGTEKLTGRYAPMRKHAASVLRAVPAPTATATVEADHARLRRPEPPGMDEQAQGKELRPHQRRLQGAENLRRQAADGMPQVRYKPQVRGLPRVWVPATEDEVNMSFQATYDRIKQATGLHTQT